MKIVLYTEGLPFAGDTAERQALGGSESAFIAVARELAKMGHEVHAHCICPAPGFYDGVHYQPADTVRRWEQEPCDLFLCSRFFSVLALDLRARRRVYWMHDVLMESLAAGLRSLLSRIDAIFCLSRYHGALVTQVLPEARSKLKLSANGVDLDLVAEATAGVAKRHRMLFTSRSERGLREALDIYEALNDRKLEFLYCSYAPLPDPNVRALEHECGNRMRAMRARGFDVRSGSFDKRSLYRVLASSKAVVYPTRFPEIFCISALEAQACGTAFLTVDDFALRETVGYPGSRPGDLEGLLARTRSVLNDDAQRIALEDKGRRHAQRYTWRAVAENFLTIEPEPAKPSATAIARRVRVPGAGPVMAAAQARIFGAHRAARAARAVASAPSGPAGGAPAKISCLTVTYDRLAQLKRAISCYCDQTYSNRELVIVTDGAPRFVRAVEDHLATLHRDDIRLVPLAGERRTLGKLRNRTLDEARGEIVCQWDDDDLSHPDRLAVQAARMAEEGAEVCFMTDHLQFIARDRRLMWTDWTHSGRVTGKWQLVPGTLMMRRDPRFRYPETGEAAVRGEDSALIDALYDRLKVARLSGEGHLYLYAYHGRNTFSETHHRGLINAAVPVDFLHRHQADLAKALSYYGLPSPVSVFAAGEVLFLVTN